MTAAHSIEPQDAMPPVPDTPVIAEARADYTAAWHDADDLRWAARHWAVRIGVKAPQVHVRPMHSKWASISTRGRLTLNTDLLAIPKPLGEFVVVHELVHLLVPNHGVVFKSFMHAFLPDWQARERQLRAHDLAHARKPSHASKRRRRTITSPAAS